MNYQECFNEIIKLSNKQGHFSHLSDISNKFEESDYNKIMDLINYLVSRCVLRTFSWEDGSVTHHITPTRLGIGQLRDEIKRNNLLSEFKILYDIDNEE